MINSKHFNKIIACAVVFALAFSVLIVYASNNFDSTNIPEYQKRMFNGEIVSIDIRVDGDDWQNLLENAEEKEYISGEVTINGEIFSGIGVRTKGNSSLEKVAESESDRHSINIKFNKYVKGQTYYGLDTLCLNNIMSDPTYMREYLSYEIMSFIGVPSPLTNYAKITVNGEDYGFLLLLERYDQAFLDRVYSTTAGHLYNVKKERGEAESTGGGSLVYAGSEISGYSSISDNAVFSKTDESDMQRVITALKNLNDGANLEEYWDVDGILRYLAAHTVIVNLNSYISDDQQNFYLYERDGKITVLPWSYHLAFGGNISYNSEASAVVNLPIDTPVYGVAMEERPLLDVLLALPEYKEKYHEYLRQITEGYFDSGLFEQTISELDAKIGEYIKTDVSGFHTYEQYQISLSNLIELGHLRAESITGQLNAVIPATTDGQRLNNSSLVNTSFLNAFSYESRLFNGEVASVEILMDETEWQAFLRNAQSKEWYAADVIINGELFTNIGVRTKGNSSLSQSGGGRSGSGGNSRYSLQFKMDKFVKGQTYYGLNVFCVNNMMGDATYMKDYIAYDIMNYIGVATPLTNYAKVMVNGENYGFGVMLERYDKTFMDRVYDTLDGYLYSVKIQMGQRDNFMEFGRSMDESNNQQMPDRNEQRNSRGNMGGGRGGFGGSNGGSLVYTGDELRNYSSIFDNAVFGTRTTEEDMQRVVTAIKNLNERTELEQYWDVDGTLRYFAAHTVVVNLDSYVSNMQQNYYLYEAGGKVTILPWDYNLAFGGFQSGNASSFVNFPIDTPVSGANMEDRPLLNVLLEIPEYKAKYHEYLREIAEGYFFSGLFEQTVRELDAKINEYVKNDVNTYFTYEQYESVLPVFIELCMLRAESIAGQLDGTVPSTTTGQAQNSSALINASHLNMSALGSMMGGGMGGNLPNMMPEWNFDGQMPNIPGRGNQDRFGFPDGMPEDMEDWFGGQMPNIPEGDNRGSGRQQPNMPGRDNQDGFNFPDGMEDWFNNEFPNIPGENNPGGFDFPDGFPNNSEDWFDGQMPNTPNGGNQSGSRQQSNMPRG